MKSEDYKRGVREMAAAIKSKFGSTWFTSTWREVESIEQRLLADPVPKFAVGMVVMHDPQPGRVRKQPVLILESSFENGDWLYNGNYYEAGLRALTPLEATGKE